MGKIVILDENTANQIAAGEVIERPASIVKEMVENSLDAKATSVTVEIVKGGIKSIRITDNGSGIEADDVAMAFERHATSKIRRIDDLNSISTMGFRGEALASIASVSKVEVITKTKNAANGIRVVAEGGVIVSEEPVGAPKGTTFIVKELFYNTPARYKFLKKDATEAGYIYDIITRIALARPDVSIKLINKGKTVLHTPNNRDLLSTIYSLYGKGTAHSVIPVNVSDGGIEVSGFIGRPEISRGNRNHESIFVNGRAVYNKTITAALEEAYKTRLMKKRFPFAVLKLNISPHFVDVNVHPAKLEVRFSDEQKIFRIVYMAVSEALSGAALIQKVEDNIKTEKKTHPPVISPDKQTEQLLMANKPIAQGKPITQMQEQMFDNLHVNNNIELKKPLNYQDKTQSVYNDRKQSKLIIEEQVMRDTQNSFEKHTNDDFVYNKMKQEEESKSDDERERLLNARIVGQAFQSYIILEEGGELFLIDQHAAHERIRYEKIKKQYTGQKPYSQGLLSPLTVELTELEMQKFNDLTTYIERLGFEAEVFGIRTIIVRAVPYIMSGMFSNRDFLDIIDKLSHEVSSVSEIIPEETIYMMACKSAIKANRTMSAMEIESLVKELVKTENPYTCVHGRPIIISMSKKEMEKRFKRIV